VKGHSEQDEEAEGADEPDQSHPFVMNQVHSSTHRNFIRHRIPKCN